MLPPEKGPAPRIVSSAADGTSIHSRDGPIEVKLGAWWTGARQARPGSWLLWDKGYYATTGPADRFGQTSLRPGGGANRAVAGRRGVRRSQNLDALGRSLAHYIRVGQIEPKEGDDLPGYFCRRAAVLHTYLGLREAGHAAQMAPRGSGMIEHGMDLVSARRCKRQGMRSWNRKGTDDRLAARVLALDPDAWRSLWGQGLM